MSADSNSNNNEQCRLERLFERPAVAVKERARNDAPADFCHMCIEATPLAYENAHDIIAINFMERAVTDTLTAIQYGGYPNMPREVVERKLFTIYEDAFFGACPEPTDCEVCANPHAYDVCGHGRMGEPCPAPQRHDCGAGAGVGPEGNL